MNNVNRWTSNKADMIFDNTESNDKCFWMHSGVEDGCQLGVSYATQRTRDALQATVYQSNRSANYIRHQTVICMKSGIVTAHTACYQKDADRLAARWRIMIQHTPVRCCSLTLSNVCLLLIARISHASLFLSLPAASHSPPFSRLCSLFSCL